MHFVGPFVRPSLPVQLKKCGATTAQKPSAAWSSSDKTRENMISRNEWLAVSIFGIIFATSASAQTEIDKLRGCLTIEDASKERLDCYDGVVPPDPKPKPPTAKVVPDCKFLKEEDERLGCFNRFLVKPARPTAVPKGAPKVQPSK